MYQFTVFDRQPQTPKALRHARIDLLTLTCTAIFLTILVFLSIGGPSSVYAQTTPLIGNHPTLDASAMHTPVAATRVLSIHLSFAPRNPVGLAKLLADLQDPASPRYHRWLSPAKYNANFGRTADEVSAVQQWLSGKGFRIVDCSPRGMTTVATVAQAESAFATNLIASSNGAVYANANDPQVPARLAGVIGSIEGLDDARHSLALAIQPPGLRANAIAASLNRSGAMQQSRRRLRNQNRTVLIADAVPDYNDGLGLAFGPADLWTFYDETPLLNAGTNGGAGDCVAVVEDTDYYSPSVAPFDSNFSLPGASVTRVLADGTNPGRNGDEIEALLDIEWAHAVAPDAAIEVYIGDPATAPIDPLVDALQRGYRQQVRSN